MSILSAGIISNSGIDSISLPLVYEFNTVSTRKISTALIQVMSKSVSPIKHRNYEVLSRSHKKQAKA